MRIAIFSDVHGNWNAFRGVLEDIKKKQVDLQVRSSIGDHHRRWKGVLQQATRRDVDTAGDHPLEDITTSSTMQQPGRGVQQDDCQVPSLVR